MTPFEQHLRIEITKQAKRVKALQGTAAGEVESVFLRNLVTTYDEFQKFKTRHVHVALCVCCHVEAVPDESHMCAECQMAEAEYWEER